MINNRVKDMSKYINLNIILNNLDRNNKDYYFEKKKVNSSFNWTSRIETYLSNSSFLIKR